MALPDYVREIANCNGGRGVTRQKLGPKENQLGVGSSDLFLLCLISVLLVPAIDGIQQEARGEENGDAGHKDGLPRTGQGRGRQG